MSPGENKLSNVSKFIFNFSDRFTSFNGIKRANLCGEKGTYNEPAAWLAQLGERRSAEREVAGSNPGRTNT